MQIRADSAPQPLAPPRQRRADVAAMWVSLVCVVHCLTLPLLVSIVPAAAALVSSDLTHSWVHWGLLALAVPVSGYALVRSLSRHGGGLLLAAGVAALAVLFLAVAEVFGRAAETPLTVAAASALLAVHLINYRRCRPQADNCH